MVFLGSVGDLYKTPGADPGIYISGGALDRRGVWGPPRSPAGPGQLPVGGPGGRSHSEAHEN